jgi:lipopolysaccharide export system permease protein
MIVWFSSGQALTACLWPIMWFALPFFAAILVLSLFLSPWAEQRRLEYERQLESKDEITLLTPGLFREFGRAKLVVFIESINTFDGTIRNVFLHSVDEGKDSTTVARSGMLQGGANGDRFIVLKDGRRYEGKPRHRRLPGRRIRLAWTPDRAASCARCRPRRSHSDRDADHPRRAVERAELFWRLSVPISALVLTLLAVPLAYVNPRIGRREI